jgi:hypothetical protein
MARSRSQYSRRCAFSSTNGYGLIPQRKCHQYAAFLSENGAGEPVALLSTAIDVAVLVVAVGTTSMCEPRLGVLIGCGSGIEHYVAFDADLLDQIELAL